MPYKVITAKNRVIILRHTGDWLPLPILPTPTTPLPSDNHQSQKISWIIQILSWPIPYPVLLPFSFPPPFLYIKRLLGEVSSLVNSATARFLVLINVLFTSDGSMGKFGDNKYMGSLHAIFCNPLSVCNYLKMKKLKKQITTYFRMKSKLKSTCSPPSRHSDHTRASCESACPSRF